MTAQHAYYLVFNVEDKHFALALDVVERIYHAVLLTDIPDAPPLVTGLVNLHGNVLPVISVRSRMGLPQREVLPEDRLIVVTSGAHTLALLVDGVHGVHSSESLPVLAPEELLPDMSGLAGVATLDDEIVVLQDIDELLHPTRSALHLLDMGD